MKIIPSLGFSLPQTGGIGNSPITYPLSGLQLWLDASDSTSISDSGTFVWADKSGNGNHATQSVSAQKPSTGARAINGLNALDFDGVADGLSCSASLYSIASGANTFIVVYQSDNTGGSIQRLFSGSPSGNFLRYGAYITTTEFRTLHRTSSLPVGVTAARNINPHVGGFYRSGINMTPFYDGVAGTAATNSEDMALVNLIIGNNPLFNSEQFDGLIGEILLYNRALSTAELNQVGSALQAKWGCVWTGM